MDPAAVLEGIAKVRDFLDLYGNMAFGYVSTAVTFVYDLVLGLPGWVMDVWHFVSSIYEVIKLQLGF